MSMSTIKSTVPVRRREVDLPGRWRQFGDYWARALYSRRQRGYIASVFRGDPRDTRPDSRSVIGVYPTADEALDAAGTMLGMGEERVCTLADIDRARKELRKHVPGRERAERKGD